MKALPLNVRENMRMHWAARPTIKLRPVAQYADTLMQLGGNKLSSSTASQPSSSRPDSQPDRLRDRAQKRSSGRRNKTYNVVVQLEVSPADGEKGPGSVAQHIALGASSSSSSDKGRFRVCLKNDYIMDRCPSAANKNKSIAI